jgi:hypothetical protein
MKKGGKELETQKPKVVINESENEDLEESVGSNSNETKEEERSFGEGEDQQT